MRRIFLIQMMLSAALVSTASCTAVGSGTDGQEQSESGSCIVLYCSRTGNTERMAQTISTVLGCDMIEIVPETPYEDDYNAMLDRAGAELAAIEQGDYPAVATSVENFDTYDIVFVGYPIWYGHMATPMQAFLHEHADLLDGKRIALFASSGSSGIGTSERDAASLVPDAVFTESLLLTSSSLNSMESLVPVWLDEMQISDNQTNADMENNKIRLTVEGGRTFTATLVDNTSAQALVEQLAKGDITVDMEDYADMEKVGTLGISLPRNDRPTTTGPGDLILYQGHNFVIYYDTNSWNFTRLGKIDNVSQTELKAALGEGDVRVTLSLEH
ncbi:MAG TPA: hypothetical protein IAC05_05555 [Candidatus Coprenecus stercorigallinarum]|nr:hypothetical protein [Candidatus Coprenecus stercorigallinarum]